MVLGVLTDGSNLLEVVKGARRCRSQCSCTLDANKGPYTCVFVCVYVYMQVNVYKCMYVGT